jgi:hypothetical protein
VSGTLNHGRRGQVEPSIRRPFARSREGNLHAERLHPARAATAAG